MSDKDRLLITLSNRRFMRSAKILSPWNIKFLSMQEFDSFIVGNTREWSLNILQLGDIASYSFKLCPAVLKNGLDNMRNEILLYLEAFLMVHESHFRFDHPELNQMATGLGFLRTESGSERIHFPKRHGCSFHIELSTLSKISIFIKVFGVEQIGCPLS
ncbi:hypothetical protein D3C85_1265670 [compost metagenome]